MPLQIPLVKFLGRYWKDELTEKDRQEGCKGGYLIRVPGLEMASDRFNPAEEE